MNVTQIILPLLAERGEGRGEESNSNSECRSVATRFRVRHDSAMQAADILRECESWEDFQQRLSVLTDTEKGDAFALFVKSVLQIHPLYATKLEKVWLQSEVEFTIREHLGVPLKDYGIDIVARTFDGDYWAVQAKYRSDRNASL